MRNYKFCNHVTATLTLLFISIFVLLSASQVVAAPISISNTTIRDTWTNSLPDPITNDLNPDKFMLNSDRAVQIFPSAFLVLPPDPLTMDTGRGEGLIASTQPDGITFDKELRFGVTAGTGITLSTSVIGLVWNFIDPSINANSPHYRFQLGTVTNVASEDQGFVIAKRDGNGMETILFQDNSIGLDPLSVYNFGVDRDPINPDDMTVSIVKVSGPGEPAGQLVLATATDSGSGLGGGAVGLYADNTFDNQWQDIQVPEPNTVALAGMGIMGLMIFLGTRFRRQLTVHAVL
ncbi:MAG: hypothetical protein CMJ81_16995 [Planctomycetaceae bacterium]|nr:hypothetical protein [Planctomycetaceae bacterium]MBP63309.1 hypothetical protein [Planctomycetaceae bacterium]